jgi:hypothetical protein
MDITNLDELDRAKWNVGWCDEELTLHEVVPFDNATDAIEYSALMNRTGEVLYITIAPAGVISFEDEDEDEEDSK